MKHIRLFLVLTLALISVAFGAYPLTVSDELGREVTLEAEPLRIVTMIPSHTETVCAIDACDKIVGVDEWSNYPAEIEALPQLGNAFAPNLEAIVALEPDLVLVDESSDLARQLEQVGLTVFAGTPQTFDETFETFTLLGRLVNRQEAAQALIERVQGDIDAVAEQVADAPRPRVYHEIDATPYSVGPNSYIGTLIDKAGGDNIVEDGMGDFPQLDPEFIVAADPQVITLGSAPYGESQATLAARPGWESLAALSQGRVAELSAEQNDTISRPGPRIAEAVRLFASIFHPELFD